MFLVLFRTWGSGAPQPLEVRMSITKTNKEKKVTKKKKMFSLLYGTFSFLSKNDSIP